MAAGRDPIAFLTTSPPECSVDPGDAALRLARDRGRTAFESPVLVGGPAGSMGVSCAACHSGGRRNPDFFIAHLSGEPGTADVSSSVFSKVRDDGVFNPKPIPDIAMRDGTQIEDRSSPAFHEKLRGLIVDEFDGQPPPASVFEDVRVYLDSLKPSACPADQKRRPIHVSQDLAAARVALEAAEYGAADEKLFWLNVARRRLERIDERYQLASLVRERAELALMNRSLIAAQSALRAGEVAAPITAKVWQNFVATIEAGEGRSLYIGDVLRLKLSLGKTSRDDARRP